MNKANNRITFRLESDLDGSLGVEDGKDLTLSMTITDHIDSYVDAFRSFLLAAFFPSTLVDKALTKEVIIPYGPDVDRATEMEKTVAALQTELAEKADERALAEQVALDALLGLKTANDMIAELQEANDMLGDGDALQLVAGLKTRGEFLAAVMELERKSTEGSQRSDPAVAVARWFPHLYELAPISPSAHDGDVHDHEDGPSAEQLAKTIDKQEDQIRALKRESEASRDKATRIKLEFDVLNRKYMEMLVIHQSAHTKRAEDMDEIIDRKDAAQAEKSQSYRELVDGTPFASQKVQGAKALDLHVHDSLLEPTYLTRTVVAEALEAASQKVVDEGVAAAKPPTQTLAVQGIDTSEFGSIGESTVAPNEYVTNKIRELVAHPHFQNFAVEHSGARSDEVMDSVLFATQFVETNSFMASFDPTRPLKFSERLFWRMVATYHDWAKAKGILLE